MRVESSKLKLREKTKTFNTECTENAETSLRAVGKFDGSSHELLEGRSKFGDDLYSLVAKNLFMVELNNREFPILLP